MGNFIRHLFILIGISSVGFCSEDTIQAPSTNLYFTKEIELLKNGDEIPLRATGAATRSKMFVNIYSIAHYMRKPLEGREDGIYDEIMRDNQPKQLSFKWVKNLTQSQLKKGFKEAFENNAVGSESLDKQKEEFLAFFDQDVERGDFYDIRWFPGGRIEVEINGAKKGELTDPLFAKTFWSIYFGPKSVVNRNRLVSQLKAN